MKGIDWAAVGAALRPRAEAVTDERAFGLLLPGARRAPRGQSRGLLEGSVEPPRPDWPRYDPGFACLEGASGAPVVYHVDAGGPAERAGVCPA